MSRRILPAIILGVLVVVVVLLAGTLFRSPPETPDEIQLPAPRRTGGRPLMEVLGDRRSDREFSPAPLSPQTLSDLLWAAFGVNRPDGRRTAPSIMNWQETELYLAFESGVYRYEPREHRLIPVLGEDLRGDTGDEPYITEAPLTLLYVTDYSKLGGYADSKLLGAHVDTAFIGQNVYLFCASEGLRTIFRGHIDRELLGEKLGLDDDRKVTYVQTVGAAPSGS